VSEPEKRKPTTRVATRIRQNLTSEEQRLISEVEQYKGRPLTEQEINLGLEQVARRFQEQDPTAAAWAIARRP